MLAAVPPRIDERPRLSKALWRGVRLRCPRCGGGRLFRRWVTMATNCPHCGMRFERGVGFMLGVMAINISVCSAVFAVYLVLGFVLTWPDPPIGWLTAIGIAILAATPFVFYPWSKTVWSAIDYFMRPLDVVETAEAMTYLARRDSV
jgi:uncharacterized protein (DUF983 family)